MLSKKSNTSKKGTIAHDCGCSVTESGISRDVSSISSLLTDFLEDSPAEQQLKKLRKESIMWDYEYNRGDI